MESSFHVKLNKCLFVFILVNLSVCCYYIMTVENSATVGTEVNVRQGKDRSKRLHPQSFDDLNIPNDPIDYRKREVFDIKHLRPGRIAFIEPEHCDTCDFIKVSKSVFIYSVYYDVRVGRHIRIVGIAVSLDHGDVKCMFEGNDTAVPAFFHKSQEDHALPFAAHLITCSVPDNVDTENLDQNGVTLVGQLELSNKITEIKTNVKVVVHKPVVPKREFTVCIPPLYGNLSLFGMVEFLEVSKILGAEHFVFYDYDVHKQLHSLLQTYEKAGTVTFKPWKHKFTHSHVWYFGQSASVWDCILDNMDTSRYIVLNDIDEFIVPRNADDWITMMEKINNETMLRANVDNIAAYRFQSSAFDNSLISNPPSVSSKIKNLVTLEAIIRYKELNEQRSKLIVDPQKVLEVGIHHLARGLKKNHGYIVIQEKDAVLHHYRSFGLPVKQKLLIIDKTMWKYEHKIIGAFEKQRSLLENFNIYH